VKSAGRTYGLAPLSFEEAARLLGIPEEDFVKWLLVKVRPSPPRWTEWTAEEERRRRPLPEILLRLYLTQHPPAEEPAPLRAALQRVRQAWNTSSWPRLLHALAVVDIERPGSTPPTAATTEPERHERPHPRRGLSRRRNNG
jgi:hypothetical protein